MEKNELIRYWLESAQKDLETMEKLYQMDELPWSLFLGQLVLEKTLKAIYTQNVGQDSPRIHDLSRLALLAGLELSKDRIDQLDIISSFNLNTRYPDIKLAFYKQCTDEFTTNYLGLIRDYYQWLLSIIETN